jgi:hypothetical protein
MFLLLTILRFRTLWTYLYLKIIDELKPPTTQNHHTKVTRPLFTTNYINLSCSWVSISTEIKIYNIIL